MASPATSGTSRRLQSTDRATDDYEAHLLVPRGLIFGKDTYIPLGAVVRRSGAEVFINVPRLVVGSMPWSEPPTRRGEREKLGPPAGEVENLYRSRSPSIYERRSGA